MELTGLLAGATAAADARTARLRGLPLALARLGCIVLAASALALFIAGLPVQLSALRESMLPIAADLRRTPAGELALYPWSRGPLVAAGILGGDVLVAVDGVNLSSAPGAPVPPDLFRRPLGTEVRLLVRTGDAAPRSVTLIAGGRELRSLAPAS